MTDIGDWKLFNLKLIDWNPKQEEVKERGWTKKKVLGKNTLDISDGQLK